MWLQLNNFYALFGLRKKMKKENIEKSKKQGKKKVVRKMANFKILSVV